MKMKISKKDKKNGKRLGSFDKINYLCIVYTSLFAATPNEDGGKKSSRPP
ncbi:MAG: hypothetical protein IKA70_00955 [Alistipes sp.]|nr:hypothetical protein [Alistipes sp.]